MTRHQRENCLENPDREEKRQCPVCPKAFIRQKLREHIRKHGVNAEELMDNMKLPIVTRKRVADRASDGPSEKRVKTKNDQIAGKYSIRFYYISSFLFLIN